MLLPTVVNVLLAFVPKAVIAVMHTTIISASMTAYSTAVGPSSRRTNSTRAREKRLSIQNSFLVLKGSRETRTTAHSPQRAVRKEEHSVRQPYGSLAILARKQGS